MGKTKNLKDLMMHLTYILSSPKKKQYSLSNVSDHNKFAKNYKKLTDEQKKCLIVENENGSYKKKKWKWLLVISMPYYKRLRECENQSQNGIQPLRTKTSFLCSFRKFCM